ncbi:peptidoglycan recognition protein [Streptomyces sp. YC504]|uniref:Peptidoglycan recognition protein n=1 Tax=Streptomyces mesophilus TaxID=1775132 RepID=A0A6G4XCK8_9ACTN|nr:peptidoglycan recognition protein [Streptomyces mesophilus]NGO75128.1 peptidoglycan recognition protein [Streptomyces mesophilus]
MKRRAWLTLSAVLVGGGGIITYAVASPSDGPSDAGRAKRPVKVYDLTLKSPASGKRELPRTETEQFSMLGVSWTDAEKRLQGTAQVRTRSIGTGEWSGWQDLEANVDPLEDPEAREEARGATEPIWVGPSDGVQVQVVHKDGSTSALPKGLEVSLVDPGVVTKAETQAEPVAYEPAAFAAETSPAATGSPSDSASPSASPSESVPPSESVSPSASASTSTSASATASPSPTVPTAPPSTVPKPSIVSRAGWGANESMSPDPSNYNAGVKTVFVHHTVDSNSYSCADSAALVRGIYAYHVNTNHWNDIGYNFFVDKCGTIFEGRKGGVDLPVTGAHTYGWNSQSAGIAVLGTYTDAGVSTAAQTAVARLAAWKLGQYGIDPSGSTQMTAPVILIDPEKPDTPDNRVVLTNYFGAKYFAGQQYTFKAVSGHRDGYNTQCPGNSLYAQLPAIRTMASGPVQGLKVTSVSGATASGTTYYTKGAITAKWSTTTPGSLIKRFELLVDGKVAATASGTATSAAATLALGNHTVAVRAVHQSGKAVTTTAQNFVAETTAPTFSTTPNLALATGTVSTTSVPVSLRWKAADNAALQSVKQLVPTATTFGPTTTSVARTAKPGTATTWSMAAYDVAGNSRTASAAYTPVILQETSAVRSGSWTSRSSTSYLGGKSYSSGSKGASLTWTFTGRSASWVVSRASTSGQAYVYVDGVKVSTVDLKSSTVKYRQAIWTKTWSGSAKHTVKIVVVGTSGRPTITTDGLVYIK